jgi:hypothetical protein
VLYLRKNMNENRIRTLTHSLSNRPSRRDVVRGLVGTGFGLGALRLPDTVEARKKKKQRKQKKQKAGQRCRTGKQFGSISVPASGASVSTPVLKKGQRYRLRASGFWNTNATHGNDAFAAFPFANPNAPVTTFEGARLGLSVDGDSPDQWGSYSAGHIYEREVIGQGAALSLRFTDPVPADNSGSLLVDVFCA